MLLPQPLNVNSIRFFRGVVDLYIARGQLIARKWPSPPRQPNTPAQLAARKMFADMNIAVKGAGLQWHESFNDVSIPSGRSVVDLKRKIVIWNMSAGTWLNPPRITSVWQRSDAACTYTMVYITHAAGYPEADAEAIGWRAASSMSSTWDLRWSTYSMRTCRTGYVMENIRPRIEAFKPTTWSAYDPDKRTWFLRFEYSGPRLIPLMQHWDNIPPSP